jgi:hypothetical protein
MHIYKKKESYYYIYIGYTISIITFILSLLLLIVALVNKTSINNSLKINNDHSSIMNQISWVEIESIPEMIASILLFILVLSFKCDNDIKSVYTNPYGIQYNNIYYSHINIDYTYSLTKIIKYIIGCVLFMYNFFHLIWIIIGCIIFTEKKHSYLPDSFNYLVYLQLGYGLCLTIYGAVNLFYVFLL